MRRRAARGLAAAGVLLAAGMAVVRIEPRTDALGPAEAITPDQTSPALSTGNDPVISGRGEVVTAVASDQVAVVQRDDALLDAPTTGRAAAVSANACVAAVLRSPGVIDAIDRCDPSRSGTVVDIDQESDGTIDIDEIGPLAVSADGRFVVAVVDGTLVRYDRDGGPRATMSLAGLPAGARVLGRFGAGATLGGIDVSADGAVAVATVQVVPLGSGGISLVVGGPASTTPTTTTTTTTTTLPPSGGGGGFNLVVGSAAASLAPQQAPPTSFVVAWDATNGAVEVVSTPDGSAAGLAANPSVSADGRHVAFASAVARAGGETGTGPWVYVRDRTTTTFRLVSDPALAARRTSISDDASQVAFVQVSPCAPGGVACFTTQRIVVARAAEPGMIGAIATEIVNGAANGAVAGEHDDPVLSGNGRYVAWTTTGGAVLLGRPFPDQRHVVLRRRDASLAADPVAVGDVAPASVSVRTATVRNTGTSSVVLDEIAVDAGAVTVVGGSCTAGASLPPGAACTVDLRLGAPGAGAVATTLHVREVGFDAVGVDVAVTAQVQAPATVPTTSTSTSTTTTTTTPSTTSTTTTTTPAPGSVVLVATPDPIDLGDAVVGTPTGVVTVLVSNTGSATATATLDALGGEHPGDFEIVGDACTGAVLGPFGSCTIDVRMVATDGGPRRATLTVTAGGTTLVVDLLGAARFEPQLLASPQAVTERGVTLLVGQGFPPSQSFDVRVEPAGIVVPATTDAEGVFKVPFAPLDRLALGTYAVRVDERPGVFASPSAPLVVVLATFRPQGPSGPAFGTDLLVSRGG